MAKATILPKVYTPGTVEARIYDLWERSGAFHPAPNAPPYTIIMPPPNVTGALHLGHALTTTVEDLLIRWRRMHGDAALWLPGVDHAGIATQNVVEAELAREGIDRHQIGREAFLARVKEWVAQYRPRIREQLRRLGASCDWDREVFTLDGGPQRAVRATFASLYQDGKISRGHRIINWCPRCRTALSDLEVEYHEEQGHLWHVRYPFLDAQGQETADGIVIATTRPETIPADVAVAVHPDDASWQAAVGRSVRLPLRGFTRALPIIADPAVEIGFGTGALKITPGHDPLDFEIGERHGLEAIRVIDWDGEMTEAAGAYAGLDRDTARQRVVQDLEADGYLIKTEAHMHSVGHCQRCATAVEPLVSDQWFIDMTALAQAAADVVEDGRVRIVPERFTKVYLQWLEGIRPWCISRQLWWGHRIPVWYCLRCDGEQISVALRSDGGSEESATQTTATLAAQGLTYDDIAARAVNVVIGEGVHPIVSADADPPGHCPACGDSPLIQDPDVLDTWFSSALWPHSTLGWPDAGPSLAAFYPTAVMETGYDILFFWVARMIMLSLYNMDGVPPFQTVYLHGLVRDPQGRKMSKSLGNVIDPLEVGEQFGTDALRFSLATGSTPGQDMKLTDERLEGARNFANKVWNGARFVLTELDEAVVDQPQPNPAGALEDRWILTRLDLLTENVDHLLTQFQIGEAGRQIYDFLWNEFFDWYVEASKIRLRSGDSSPLPILATVLDQGLRLLHPYMPFLSEEIWQHLRPHLTDPGSDTLIRATYPQPDPAWRDAAAESAFTLVQDVVRAVRRVRAEKQVQPARWVEAYVVDHHGDGRLRDCVPLIETLARVRPLHVVTARTEAPSEAVVTQMLGRAEVILPLGGLVDLKEERARLQRNIAEAESYLQRVRGKLSNQGFRANAPAEVVAREEQRERETAVRVAGLEERLRDLPT